ncbi:Orexin receptor type 1 [Holothuria leucospilota]|uniref:Orexin receptor type 1 n=1 Tax=Holothuria leucospilota TaxID=206669 RepID=A0A9Q0YQB9_HOLLE|nr:Orexin receptor type 1 [Holothuria leucospilota]
MAIMLVGVCGNTLIFVAYCLSRRLQTKTNIFVINLAAADILTCACLPITTLAILLDVNVNTRSWLDPLCAVDIGAIKISFNCSFTTLTLIALNRSGEDEGKMNATPVTQNQVDITKNLFYIFVAFLICFGPVVVSEAIDANDIVKSYTSIIIVLNSCVNPIIYGIKHPHFRQILHCILSCSWSEIPEPAFRCVKSGLPSSAVAGSRGKHLNAISMAVSEMSNKV